MRSRVAWADRALGASPARLASSRARRAATSASSTCPSSARARASAAQTGGARRGHGLRRVACELRLAQPDGALWIAAGDGDRRPGQRSCAPPPARCRRPAGRAAPLRTPPRQRRARRRGPGPRPAARRPCRAASPRPPPEARPGRGRARRRACAIAVLASPSSPASCERRSASCVGIAGRIVGPPSRPSASARSASASRSATPSVSPARTRHQAYDALSWAWPRTTSGGRASSQRRTVLSSPALTCRPEATATIRPVRSRSPDRSAWPIASSSSPRASCQADALACSPATSSGWSVRSRARRISANSA